METCDSPFAPNAAAWFNEKPSNYTAFGPNPARLSVRLMSL
jgi:hypothetical protein